MSATSPTVLSTPVDVSSSPYYVSPGPPVESLVLSDVSTFLAYHKPHSDMSSTSPAVLWTSADVSSSRFFGFFVIFGGLP